MKQEFTIIIEQDEKDIYVGRVLELKGCLSQGDTLYELIGDMSEAIQLYLNV